MTPNQIRGARKASGMTQVEAAASIKVGVRAWQEWEANNRQMPPGLWDWFRVRAGLIALADVE